MSCIDMKLNKVPFEQIKTGIKTMEVRLYDDKRQKLRTGDRIRFINVEDSNDTIETGIVALHKFDACRELFVSEHFDKCGFVGKTVDEAVQYMRNYYAEDGELKFKVVGIEFAILKNNS